MNTIRLLRWQSFIPLIVVLMACSAAYSFTYSLTSASLETIEAPGLELNSQKIVLFSRSSRLPQTGTIPLNLAEELWNIGGVEVVSPEVMAPVEVQGHIAFLRGVNPIEFIALEGLEIDFPSDENWVLVGSRIAKLLSVGVGDVLSVKGLLVNKSFELRVLDVLKISGPLSDELIAPLIIGQELRGITKNQVTFIRAKISPETFSAENLKGLLGKGHEKPSFLERFASLLRPGSIKTSQTLSYIGSHETFVEKEISVSKTLIWALTMVVVFSSSLAIYNGVGWVLEDMKPTLNLLMALGFSHSKMRRSLALLFSLISFPSGLIGYMIGHLFFKHIADRGELRLMFHALAPSTSLDAVIASVMAASIITLVSLVLQLLSTRTQASI